MTNKKSSLSSENTFIKNLVDELKLYNGFVSDDYR